MARLIDADKTIGHIKTRLLETALNNSMVVCDVSYIYQDCADNRIETWVDEMPTVDAEPVRHGTWINISISANEYEPSSAQCDLCGARVYNNLSSIINYCPHCGAKMDEVGNGKI